MHVSRGRVSERSNFFAPGSIASPGGSASGRIERWISWLADHSSPVLVKEVRQALKSRSFLLTYMLLLFTALIWSVMGMAITLTEGYGDAGGMMLVGYLWILGFPLVIVVPLTAYRSLCREFEEDTLHLVSITTMSPRKLIIGKLVSALAQMVIYLSALAPCIAFTWLLRGLDVFHIMFAILLAVIGSASLLPLPCFWLRSAAIRFFGSWFWSE